MINKVGALFVASALAVPLTSGAVDLPKRGTYSGKYSWSEHVTVVPVEKDYMFTDAVSQGLFFNAAGSGFLHAAVVSCTSQGVIQNDQFSFSGNCTATDKDGDRALLKWACTRGGDRCVGTFDWIGGTGKYVGIRGRSQFDGGQIGQGPLGAIGDANWKGEWQLP